MKRFIFFTAIIIALSVPATAAHIKGGFFTYKYLGPGTGSNLRFNVTLTVYMVCPPALIPSQVSNPVNFTIFNAGTNLFIQNASVSLSSQTTLGKVKDEPCISGDQTGCYYTVVVYDLPSIELPALPDGYIFSYQRCCRINGISNIVAPSNAVGNTFTIKIPGTNVGLNAHTNSSPGFLINDTAVVCAENRWRLVIIRFL